MKVSRVRKGFRSLEDAQAFSKLLAHPEQFVIEEIIEGEFFADAFAIAYCVIPKTEKLYAAP